MDRELILADKTFRDRERLRSIGVDIAVGKENEFEIKIPREMHRKSLEFGNVIYIPGTEYGGIIGEINTNTELDTISILGRTWRGMLEKKIIRPPNGQDYKRVSGELNQVLKGLIEPEFDGCFVVSEKDTGIMVNEYQFERYCTLLYGVKKMLESAGYRIQIRYAQQERGEPGYVAVSAEKIMDYSEEIELSQDSRIDFKYANCCNGINHLICTGKGELRERKIIDLYVQKDGSIGETQYYTGLDEICEVYEDTSTESEELKEKGIEKLKEKMNKASFEMNVETLGIEVEIGDIIGGRDYMTGLYARKPIVSKVYTVTNGEEATEYNIEGEEKE